MTARLPPNSYSPTPPPERLTQLIREGITAAQEQRPKSRRQACRLFWQAIEIDPRNTQAWLWLASVVERPIDQVACLETVLQIDPQNKQAQEVLERLTGVIRTPPPVAVAQTQVIEQTSLKTQRDDSSANVSVAETPIPTTIPSLAVPPPVAAHMETLPETPPPIVAQVDHGLIDTGSGKAQGLMAALASAQRTSPDWVVRPPKGEKVLILADMQEKALDPHELRLQRDFQMVQEKFRQSPYIQMISTEGNPPERYRLEYRMKGLTEQGGQILERDLHTVEILLLLDYPRLRPVCRMLTPAFHPNIDVDGTICIGDHWAAGELLTSIMIQIAQILTYQSYNIRSPRNALAARWASENGDRLPLQKTDFWE